METPFSKRMKAFREAGQMEVRSFSPVQQKTAGDMPLLGDMAPRTPEDLAIKSERDQLTANLEGSKNQIQQAAMGLRQQVASGQISQAEAEHQLDLIANKITDNSYIGYGDLDMRERAAGFGEKAGDAYGMYSMGLDPAMMAREQARLNSVQGVLGDMTGKEPMMGEGRAPMMGEGKEPK